MTPQKFPITDCYDLPEHPEYRTYRLLPKNPDEKYYAERTDRNIGWITPEEQERLRLTTIGIAGCGGMGGQLAATFLRLGIGEIRIADIECFDISNINRQFAASRETIGKSKAWETAHLLRKISDDTTLVVYPQGIEPETVVQFLSGCDVLCDEIEFWAVGARILLHQSARLHGIPIFNCNTVGLGTRLFLFTQGSATMETCLGLTYEEAQELQKKIQSKRATEEEIRRVMNAVLEGLVPELPEYCATNASHKNREAVLRRLYKEGKASILATNPVMATGFLADYVLLHLLKDSEISRTVVQPPEAPGYLYFDAGYLDARVVREREVIHG